MRDYTRHERYLDRRRLRQLAMGDTLVVHALTASAVKSARVTCSMMGKERGCYYSASVYQRTSTLYDMRITRMRLEDARPGSMHKIEPPKNPEEFEERQKAYAAFYKADNKNYGAPIEVNIRIPKTQ